MTDGAGNREAKKSSDFYKVFNNIQLEVGQESELGVDLGGPNPLVVSPIGQADDVMLVYSLRAEKTKLQVFSDKKTCLPFKVQLCLLFL